MFHRGSAEASLLPTSSHLDNGSSFTLPKITLPKLSMATIGSWVWLILSLASLGGGVHFCYHGTDYRMISCGAHDTNCELKIEPESGKGDVRTFLGSQILRASAVRVRRGKVVDAGNYKGKQLKKLGYAYTITIKEDDGQEKSFTMSYSNLGEDYSASCVKQVNQYAQQDTSEVKLEHSSGVSAGGVVMLIYGAASTALCLMLSQLVEPEKKSRIANMPRKQPQRTKAPPRR